MDLFARMAERWMLKARAEGRLSGLEGEGAPLPQRPGDAHVSAGDAAGFRIMAEAGALPEEVALGRKVEAARAELARVEEPAARKAAMRKLADLEMKREIAREARRKFLS